MGLSDNEKLHARVKKPASLLEVGTHYFRNYNNVVISSFVLILSAILLMFIVIVSQNFDFVLVILDFVSHKFRLGVMIVLLKNFKVRNRHFSTPDYSFEERALFVRVGCRFVGSKRAHTYRYGAR